MFLGFYSRYNAYCSPMLLALVYLMHHVFVGHVIDFCIALNCIACPYDHLLDKCSLWSFLNNCSCLIKLCFIVYISLVS